MRPTKEDPKSIGALRRDFAYDPETGWVTYSRSRQNAVSGQRAGRVTRFGYRAIGWGGAVYQEHRIAFALHTGRWPVDQIDHINNIKSDNRWGNLREATGAQNQRNTVYRNKSGWKGAYYSERSKRWQSLISVGGKVRYLGSFSAPRAAHEAYKKAAAEIAGEFARTRPSYLD